MNILGCFHQKISWKIMQQIASENVSNSVILKVTYITVLNSLKLHYRLHSQLLKHTVLNLDCILNNEEKNLLQKTREGDTACVQYLIDYKVNVNVQDENGMTPLMIACQAGHTDLVEEFLKAKADVNIRALFGDTALIFASRKQYNQCL